MKTTQEYVEHTTVKKEERMQLLDSSCTQLVLSEKNPSSNDQMTVSKKQKVQLSNKKSPTSESSNSSGTVVHGNNYVVNIYSNADGLMDCHFKMGRCHQNQKTMRSEYFLDY